MNILALVLAGGNGTRLHPLTAKPALPFAAGLRLIDFVLSNLVNSGIHSIYVLGQYNPRSLIKHIRTAWSSWMEDRGRFIRVVLFSDAEAGIGPFMGTANAVYRNLHLIESRRPDLVAVFSADHVYRMDVGQMARFHRERAAPLCTTLLPTGHRGSQPHEERSYWRDVGTVNAYRAAQRDVLGPAPRFALVNPEWPIHGGDYDDGRDVLSQVEPIFRMQG